LAHIKSCSLGHLCLDIKFIFRIYLSLWNMVMVSATATDCNVLVQLMIGNGLMGIS
jgi:hypothetical protein